ncbi:serine/threonine-protein kinase [Mycobacterium sp. E2479]|uniref:serine/threonine-protein kinase n=1 Tax=Mycobacterium sp. E2479 TaxID=1834134 RepID=UPI003516ED5A
MYSLIVIGATFAGYTILRLLGSGGMGEVYLAQHPRLPRRDALKILPIGVSADREFRERFNREADLAATLWHPHIVGVHDRGEFDGQLWISMDYVEGTDAGQLMKDRYSSGMPVADVCAIVTAIAGALDYAHQRGLLHRDVKPANILLAEPEDGERRILLADFGIARQLADVSGLTATNLTVGTVAYAAPEQLMGADIDGRADQYALAATAFHLLTGVPPYQHSNPVAVISQHLNAAPPKLSERRPDLAYLDHVLSTALVKDPADRFSRCREFAKALSERAASAAESDRGTEAGVTVAAPVAGSAQSGRHSPTAETTAAAEAPPPPKESPPSEAEPATTERQRHTRYRILFAGAMAVVVFAAVAATVYQVTPTNNTASAPSAPAAVLNGTYRLVYDWTTGTNNGAPAPRLDKYPDSTSWSAYRSLCKSAQCAATGTKLDPRNPQVALTPAVKTPVLHLIDGRWQQDPTRIQVDQKQCLAADGKVGPGADTELSTSSLQPQPDGTLRGVWTLTVLTNECGGQGLVKRIPFVASRTGDVPTGVTVDDPAAAVDAPAAATLAPPKAGPVLDGTYRWDYDYGKQTINGAPAADDRKAIHWWAFHSMCASTGCVATGAALADENQQEATGSADVLHFADGNWRDTPYIQPPAECPSPGTGTYNSTIGFTLEPQPDGTLHGVQVMTVLANQCGDPGTVTLRTPFVATRTGDAPPSVVLADPALF